MRAPSPAALARPGASASPSSAGAQPRGGRGSRRGSQDRNGCGNERGGPPAGETETSAEATAPHGDARRAAGRATWRPGSSQRPSGLQSPFSGFLLPRRSAPCHGAGWPWPWSSCRPLANSSSEHHEPVSPLGLVLLGSTGLPWLAAAARKSALAPRSAGTRKEELQRCGLLEVAAFRGVRCGGAVP